MTMTEEGQPATFASSVEDLALDELNRLDEQRANLNVELAVVQERIKAVKAVLRAVRPPAVRSKAAKPGGYKPLSDEFRAQAAEYLKGREGDITSSMFGRDLGWSKSTVNRGVAHMRDLGFLRLVGRRGHQAIYRSTL